MAVHMDNDITVPESTGLVVTPVDPVTTVQPFTTKPTGAVDFDATPTTTKFGDMGQDSTGTVETPGPVTFQNPSVKVVRAPRRQTAEGATTAETGSVPAQRAAAEQQAVRHASPEPDGR